ncbi:hypothetical protein GGR50DRAFT_108346 [Xylaria sp. CBS 124048]|nr:hypothetical protein GGR50DRAFT_108346 [Xylaria sp. CBS 124048]
MEKKRKLPARASARVEHISKKRNTTPPDTLPTSASISASASPQPAADSVGQDTMSVALPKSLQPGHPLPTVEKPQSDDLSHKEFQSIQESGVMAESLSRSRQKWIHDGIFEKYWTKPSKRKGAAKEDSNNPSKDTMIKIGQVTVTIEPHVLEATMYTVKDPKPMPAANSALRPVIQYGPPNGNMPPPPKPTPVTTKAASPSSATTHSSSTKMPVQAGQLTNSLRPSPQPAQLPKDGGGLPVQQFPSKTAASSSPSPSSQNPELQRPQLPAPMDIPNASPRGLESVLAAPQPAHPRPQQSPAPASHPLHAPSAPPTPLNTAANIPMGPLGVAKAPTHPSKPVPTPGPGADPIIVTLAERASEDPHLRDLMKRVAVGEAAAHELAHFQKIIDQITLDYKRKGGQQGPSADRLIVDGRTVKYFADEVRVILDIVLASNPIQRSCSLRPPPGSDPLVTMLVGEALDKPNVKSLVQRVAEGKTKFTDAVDLKSLLDRLNQTVKREAESRKAASPNPQAASQTSSGQVKAEDDSKKPPVAAATQSQNASQQVLRSKGPPLSTKPDIAAVVFEFAGGTGDRYIFPKYSILEYSSEGTQVVASFLIVRRGSKLEYGGDRALDYYQAVTLRLHSQYPKVLENLARVVASQEEVQRYMDDVMENMTRAEYVLLAMRLPRAEREDPSDEAPSTPRTSESSHSQLSGVLWDSRPASAKSAPGKSSTKPVSEDESYQSFIATVS